MKRITYALIPIAIATSFSVAAAPVTEILVTIPPPATAGDRALTKISVRVELEDGATAPSFDVTAPAPGSETSGTTFHALTTTSLHEFGTGAIRDLVTAIPPSTATSRVVTFHIVPLRSYDAANCSDTSGAPRQWKIAINGATSPKITATCALSFKPQTGCTNLRLTTGTFATVGGDTVGAQSCAEARPAAHAMLVLDRSCSMGAKANPADGSANAPRRIDALANAVQTMANTWRALRDGTPCAAPADCPIDGTTCSGGFCRQVCTAAADCFGGADCDLGAGVCGKPKDQLGAVFFSSNEVWMDDVGVASWTGAGVSQDPANALVDFDDIATHLDAIDSGSPRPSVVSPSGSTSMGDGLKAATDGFASTAGRKAIILMSDGWENTDLRVSTIGPAGSQRIKLHTSSQLAEDGTDLPLQDQLDIYSVTVGEATTVAGDVNNALATATGGFYTNTTDGTELTPFFMHILENFLRFNTFQTLLIDRGAAVYGKSAPGTSYTRTVDVTSATRSLLVSIAVTGQATERPQLRLSATPPGGGQPFTLDVGSNGQLNLPPRAGRWTLAVTATPRSAVTFDIVVIADDLLMHADTRVVPGDYGPGAQIVMQAQLHSAGQPVTGVGALSGDQVRVRVFEPGEAFGDMLAQLHVDPSQPFDGDTLTQADSILNSAMNQQPDLFALTERVVVLRDDGHAGDAKANDGIYSGRYPATVYGHYRFLFDLQGQSDAGRFSRQALESVHVRNQPSPSPEDLGMQTGDGTLTIRPKTLFGNLMGIGWANYFVLLADSGQTFRPKDNLDGSYTFTFPGGVVPSGGIHFLKVNQILDYADAPIPKDLKDDKPLAQTQPCPTAPSCPIRCRCSDAGPPAGPGLSIGLGFVLALGMLARRRRR